MFHSFSQYLRNEREKGFNLSSLFDDLFISSVSKVPPTITYGNISLFVHLYKQAVNFDGNIGPVNVVIETDGELGQAEADLKEKRRKYYRDAIESIDGI